MSRSILVSAGEASGDLYAARLVQALRRRMPGTGFFGCAGHRMQAAGVEPVVDAASLSVVGLVEVVSHIPRIYGEYRRLLASARKRRPVLAILTDSPDFHLRLAAQLRKLDIPVCYLVAPQAWAWRKGRIHSLRRNVDRLLCIFPFEEKFFCDNGVRAWYIGHPLASLVAPSSRREDFFGKHKIPKDKPLVALLPGSRTGEIGRHLPAVLDCAQQLERRIPVTYVLAVPSGSRVAKDLREKTRGTAIRIVEGETWDVLAHSDVALAASGTVTIEAALLGTPMVTFYKVTGLSWFIGKFLVDVPFYSMVNLVAEKKVVPELMQGEMTGARLADEAARLLTDAPARHRMKEELATVARKLSSDHDPIERAADLAEELLKGK